MSLIGDNCCPRVVLLYHDGTMTFELQQDLDRLDVLAFHRRECSEPTIWNYYEVRCEKGEAAVKELDRLYQWLFVPITLWPVNVQQVLDWCLDRIAAGKELGKEMELLLEVLPAPPDEKVCAVVARHEHDVQRGCYEELVTTTAKFDAAEKAISFEPELNREWDRIKKLWDVSRYQDYKGIIRRTLSQERNLRELSANWKKRDERFQTVFDAFCARWNLYGMEHDKPLLMKLSVNLTPHGTMIFIPAYWSFDAKRDVRWDGVMKLHRARVSGKQGAKLAEGIEERRKMVAKLKLLDHEAARLKLRGEKRHVFLCKGLGLVEETDPKRITRLRSEFNL